MSVMDTSSSSSSSTTSSLYGVKEVDPLLKDLSEKKQSFRRNVVSLAAELKDARRRLAMKEQTFVNETLIRQKAEAKVKQMAEEMLRLQKSLEERNGQIQASTSTAEKYLKDMDDLRSQLLVTKDTAVASASSAQSAQFQCVALIKELHEKSSLLKEHEDRVDRLGKQLDHLQNDLQARESSQKQLRDEVLRIEREIMQALSKSVAGNGCELRKLLDEVSPKNVEKINNLLINKDDEIAKLKDEIMIMSDLWKMKATELESQLEKHRRADQELKKRVLKLEFCLQETRTQTRKLQRTGERRDKALKELKDQLATKQRDKSGSTDKENFWESSGFKIVASVSMLVLVVFSRR